MLEHTLILVSVIFDMILELFCGVKETIDVLYHSCYSILITLTKIHAQCHFREEDVSKLTVVATTKCLSKQP